MLRYALGIFKCAVQIPSEILSEILPSEILSETPMVLLINIRIN